DDGALDVRLTAPPEMGGKDAGGTNPEQLFAAGFSACFLGTLEAIAARQGITINGQSARARVSLDKGSDGFRLEVDLEIHLPGVDLETARALVDSAEKRCPYARAVHGNIALRLSLT